MRALGGLRRDRDVERRAAAGAILDPGAAAVDLGEPRDEREPDARAGRGARALAERFEDLRLVGVGHAGAVVFDHELDAVVDAVETRTQIRESPGVCFTALPSRFSTMRSIMPGSARTVIGATSSARRRSATSSELATISRTSAPTSTGSKFGLGRRRG